MIRAFEQDLTRYARLFEDPRVVVSFTIVKLAANTYFKDYWLSVMMLGFLVPGAAAIIINRQRHWMILSTAIGMDLVLRVYRETNLMIEKGCNPPSSLSLFEKHLFCREKNEQ